MTLETVKVKIDKSTIRDLQIWMYELMLKTMINTLEEGNHIATGDMIRAFEVADEYIEEREDGVHIESKYAIRDPAGRILHTGSRPHCPPIEPLIEWVEAKFGLSGSDAEELAWRVWYGICKKGNKAYFWLDQFRDNLKEVRVDVTVKHG